MYTDLNFDSLKKPIKNQLSQCSSIVTVSSQETILELKHETKILRESILSLQKICKSQESMLYKASLMIENLRKCGTPNEGQTFITSFFQKNKNNKNIKNTKNNKNTIQHNLQKVLLDNDKIQTINSVSFHQFIHREGKDKYFLEYKDVENYYFFKCHSCSHADLEDGRSTFITGILLNEDDLKDEHLFCNEYKKKIIRHESTVQHEQSLHALHLKYSEKVPLFIKLEIAYFIIKQTESREVFEKLMYLFHRIKSLINKYSLVNTDALDIGDKNLSFAEGDKIFNIYVDVVFKRMKFIMSCPINHLSLNNFVLYSLTLDQWSKR